MKIAPIPLSRVPYDWEWMVKALGPVIEKDINADSWTVLGKLLSGRSEAALIRGEGTIAVIVFEGVQEGKNAACWITHLAGQSDLRGRAFLRMVRAAMIDIEEMARRAGYDEIRFSGRDWSRIFPDYLPLDGEPNGLRKVL